MTSDRNLYNGNSGERDQPHKLSPSDGYFNQRTQHSRDALIPDQPQRDSGRHTAGDGHREETLGATDIDEQQRYTTHSIPASSRNRYEPAYEEEQCPEHSPLLSSAPPSYSDATASSSTQAERENKSQGGEFSNGGYSKTKGTGHRGPFLQYNEPQRRGTPIIQDREPSGWRHQRRTCTSMLGQCSPRYWVRILLIIGSISLCTGFIIHALVVRLKKVASYNALTVT